MTLDRRATDNPERVASLEANVLNVKEKVHDLTEKLQDHIDDEGTNVLKLHVAIEKIAATSEHHGVVMGKISDTLEGLVAQNTRLHLLESHSSRHEEAITKIDARQDIIEDKVERNFEKTDRLYWISGLVATAITGIWAVFTFFAK
jgi:hypothetical protein